MGASASVPETELQALAAVERAVSISKESVMSPARGSWKRSHGASKYALGSCESGLTIASLAQSFRLSLPSHVGTPAGGSNPLGRVGVSAPSQQLGASFLASQADEADLFGAPQVRIPKLSLKGSAFGGRGSFGARASLAKAAEYEDEDDWIQVEEVEDLLEESAASPRAALLSAKKRKMPGLAVSCGADESYYFTRSGAIAVDGVASKIRDSGLAPAVELPAFGAAESPTAAKVPMTDRIVLLEARPGRGGVHKAFDLQELRFVAMKSIPIVERSKRRQMVIELHALYESLTGEGGADRRHVVAFHDAFSHLPNATVSLMVEYMDGGSLQAIVDDGGLPDERLLASLAAQAARGLRYLHGTRLCRIQIFNPTSIRIDFDLIELENSQVWSGPPKPVVDFHTGTRHVHRDLKPANMLINRRGELKISDFGIVRRLDGTGRRRATRARAYDPGAKPAARAAPLHTVKSFVGTVTYMSPERIAGGEYGTPADVWSLGLSFWAVALGSLPVRETDGYWSLLQSIRDEPPPRLPADDARWSPAFRSFLEACLAKDRSGRRRRALRGGLLRGGGAPGGARARGAGPTAARCAAPPPGGDAGDTARWLLDAAGDDGAPRLATLASSSTCRSRGQRRRARSSTPLRRRRGRGRAGGRVREPEAGGLSRD
ncbi:MAP kinase kinase [Aureococcus anophagefferens]|nr:MAP kinase kinase [Aureococcus anophagefferens]